MMKNVLLNFVMGKYRKFIVITFLFITLGVIIYLSILTDDFFLSKKFFTLILSYLAATTVIFNWPLPGFPAVNVNSNVYDISTRVILLVIMFSMLLDYIYYLL